eukprot:TRINITY_DN20954_c0_g1_i2.p1 TRINITY_DN20954_c0_g1~~TRINITY_DN20954_c0_g1_i2.p1  ORF type:complete len:577 (+),score=99.26 TRINITY_DN20954_c0_g1_i2:177-1907(+)
MSYNIPVAPLPPHLPRVRSSAELLERVRDSVVGGRVMIPTPFGKKRLVYADYTASGRSVGFIEDFIRDQVLPLYANTHTDASTTGRQMNRFREQARRIIKESVNASDDDALIFTGSGCTAAIHTLIEVLGLVKRRDEPLPPEGPLVLIGPYEHHSNELPWRESLAEVVTVPLTEQGQMDLQVLETTLRDQAHRGRRVICSFSAASNVTGILSDVESTYAIAHRYGAWMFWDYAAAAPHVRIDMSFADAVFLSPHKFLGGPGTPGVLIAKKHIFRNPVPHRPGGGTVTWVGFTNHEYDTHIEHREEGGTPEIVGSIRCGLVFQLKEMITVDVITSREERMLRTALREWANTNLVVIGPVSVPRIAIISFCVLCPELDSFLGRSPNTNKTKYLHHNYVVALLNDLFGIQARGGCSCAGPYGLRLLRIGPTAQSKLMEETHKHRPGVKPGWARLNLPFFASDEEFKYIVQAVRMVAQDGWRMLSQYRFDIRTGIWTHKTGNAPLLDLSVDPFTSTQKQEEADNRPLAEQFQESLGQAAAIMRSSSIPPTPEPLVLPSQTEGVRWFVHECDFDPHNVASA